MSGAYKKPTAFGWVLPMALRERMQGQEPSGGIIFMSIEYNGWEGADVCV